MSMQTHPKNTQSNSTFSSQEAQSLHDLLITTANIKTQIGESDDVIFRTLYVNGHSAMTVTLVFVDGMVNMKMVDDDLLKPLLQESVFQNAQSEEAIITAIMAGGLYHNSAKQLDNMEDCLMEILSGSAALIFDGVQQALTFDIKGFEKRSISEPTDENVLKGSKDSFVEIFRINTVLVRSKIKTPHLRIKQNKVGRQSKTTVALVYIEGIVDDGLVETITNRINEMDVDGVLSPAILEEYIVDRKYSLFPQMEYTERPDKLCANLLDGRVGIIIDGLPTVYIAPATFNMFLQAPEDYSFNYLVSSVIRIIRYISFAIALLLPSLYVAVTSFHPEMIPIELAISIVESKIGVPFPVFTEVIFMLVAFELLLEAGIRLPKSIGSAVSIVGAIIVGEAAVSAKFLSPAVIVVIALAGIAGFSIPNQDLAKAVRVLRIVLILCAQVAGLFGVTACVLLICYHLATIESFGVPYLSPYVAARWKDVYQDTILRFPLPFIKLRPPHLNVKNQRRQK